MRFSESLKVRQGTGAMSSMRRSSRSFGTAGCRVQSLPARFDHSDKRTSRRARPTLDGGVADDRVAFGSHRLCIRTRKGQSSSCTRPWSMSMPSRYTSSSRLGEARQFRSQGVKGRPSGRGRLIRSRRSYRGQIQLSRGNQQAAGQMKRLSRLTRLARQRLENRRLRLPQPRRRSAPLRWQGAAVLRILWARRKSGVASRRGSQRGRASLSRESQERGQTTRSRQRNRRVGSRMRPG